MSKCNCFTIVLDPVFVFHILNKDWNVSEQNTTHVICKKGRRMFLLCVLIFLNFKTNLTHRHSANAGVQDPRGRTGTHLTHKGELLSPANTVLLNLLPVERNRERMSYQHYYKSLWDDWWNIAEETTDKTNNTMNSMMIIKGTTWSDFYCESLGRDGENLCNLFTGTNHSSPQQSICAKQQNFAQEMRRLKNQIRT